MLFTQPAQSQNSKRFDASIVDIPMVALAAAPIMANFFLTGSDDLNRAVHGVSAALWSTASVNKFLLEGASSDGMTSQAMQQGGMGLILTTLILTAPPMAAMFFQGTLGSFMAYSQIGGSPVAAAPGPNGQPPGSYKPTDPTSTERRAESSQLTMPKVAPSHDAPSHTPGALGNAPTR
ncbi:TrbL/VirB6 plasmid conjugal transfer protein [Stenotrophomonas maltophilia]|nr:TrbL/VirB6 plasmid conjugal transfer protein [Stenotrophomonas maltophilia]